MKTKRVTLRMRRRNWQRFRRLQAAHPEWKLFRVAQEVQRRERRVAA